MGCEMTFQQWQEFAREVNARADRCYTMRSERGWAIAATVGIPRDGCCLHNASIDKECRGWSAPGPHVWKTARRAKRLIGDFTIYRLAKRIIDRAWDKIES